MHLKSPPPSPIISYIFGLNLKLFSCAGLFVRSRACCFSFLRLSSIHLSSLVVLFSFAFSLFSVNYAQIKIKEKVEIKPSTKAIENTSLNKNSNTYYLEYELIWNEIPCASGGIQFRYSWLIDQQKTCVGNFRIGTYITEQGRYYFTWSFSDVYGGDLTHGSGTANIYLDGLLYESITVSSSTGGITSTLISFPQCGDDAP
ncbi:MAG: hypothetical protein GY936_18385, partial [Ignavibacteriae bacterium]|nr:hypothetical protein [Ignavibacteriota bacterium]